MSIPEPIPAAVSMWCFDWPGLGHVPALWSGIGATPPIQSRLRTEGRCPPKANQGAVTKGSPNHRCHLYHLIEHKTQRLKSPILPNLTEWWVNTVSQLSFLVSRCQRGGHSHERQKASGRITPSWAQQSPQCQMLPDINWT